MSNKTLNVTLIMRNDTAANWASKNPVLTLGELGVETDTRKFKIGDGATANFNSNFKNKSVTELKDGGNVVLSTDTLTINGGKA